MNQREHELMLEYDAIIHHYKNVISDLEDDKEFLQNKVNDLEEEIEKLNQDLQHFNSQF